MKHIYFCAFLLLCFTSPLFTEELPCLMCHTDKDTGDTVHLAVQMGCTVCHIAPHDNDTPELSLFADPPDLCFTCHDTAMFTRQNQHTAVMAGMCTSCHDPHTSSNKSLLVSTGSDLCYTCHDAGVFVKASRHSPVAEGNCAACHDPHSSDNTNQLVSTGSDLCYTCHDAGVFTNKVTHEPVASGRCVSCHDPHASDFELVLSKPVPALCVSCHAGQNSGKHVISEVGYNHPLTGEYDPGKTGRKLSCISCHDPHSSGLAFMFPDKISKTNNICYLCHKKV